MSWKRSRQGFVQDAERCSGEHCSGFLTDMASVLKERGRLSRAQTRGVLNILVAAIELQRRYFWKSRDYRRDRHYGKGNCVVCGSPLDSNQALVRGTGSTCYKRVLGKWYGN